jgi:hypothetical protein
VRYSDAGAEAYARRALMPAPGPARRRPPPRRSTRRLLARAGREDRRPACGARRRAEPGGVRSAVRRARPGARATRRSVLGLHARRGWRSLRRACPSPTSARLQHGAPICWRSGTRPATAISTPATCAANSTREVWWLCATCGQEWQRSPPPTAAVVPSARGCARCAHRASLAWRAASAPPGGQGSLAINPARGLIRAWAIALADARRELGDH